MESSGEPVADRVESPGAESATPDDAAGVFLETPRMVLRRFTITDADAVFALDNDPQVMRYINGGAPTPRDEVVETLRWWLGYYQRFAGYGFWAATAKGSTDHPSSHARFLGWFHFRPGPDDGLLEPELGYRIIRDAWGTGLATEGSQALIDKGFREFGVERVRAETMVVNTASQRVMEKTGMRLVRTFHAEWPVAIAGDEHGDVEYAITRAEWRAAGRA